MSAAQTRDALREALDYLTPHPSTKGPVILDPAKMRAAVSALEAEVEELKRNKAATDGLRAVATLRDLEASLAEARALAQRAGEERDRARDLNRDLHRRVQKAESFRARHGNTYGVRARYRDRQRRREAEAERDRAVAALKVLLRDILPTDPADLYAAPSEASVTAATHFLADRELAIRVARSVTEPTEGEDA